MFLDGYPGLIGSGIVPSIFQRHSARLSDVRSVCRSTMLSRTEIGKTGYVAMGVFVGVETGVKAGLYTRVCR
jgi:hypothetical protein